MEKFKLPTELGSDFKNPSIIAVKEIINNDTLNSERTFTPDCCSNTRCHHCSGDCVCECVGDCLCQCVIDTGCHLNPFK